jgi:hypothetical protein
MGYLIATEYIPSKWQSYSIPRIFISLPAQHFKSPRCILPPAPRPNQKSFYPAPPTTKVYLINIIETLHEIVTVVEPVVKVQVEMHSIRLIANRIFKHLVVEQVVNVQVNIHSFRLLVE